MEVGALPHWFWNGLDEVKKKYAYGLTLLSVASLYHEPREDSPLCVQLLCGSHFKIRERRVQFSRVVLDQPSLQGWIHNNQYTLIEEDFFREFCTRNEKVYANDLIGHGIISQNGQLVPLLMGSRVDFLEELGLNYEGETVHPYAWSSSEEKRRQLVESALTFVKAPEFRGGRTPFGIDASGLVQLVFRMYGISLPFEVREQSLQGDALSFLEESQPGDLAFCQEGDGEIGHVGILLGNNYILHTHGQVRVDRIDHTGIFDVQRRRYSHHLRVIKSLIG